MIELFEVVVVSVVLFGYQGIEKDSCVMQMIALFTQGIALYSKGSIQIKTQTATNSPW